MLRHALFITSATETDQHAHTSVKWLPQQADWDGFGVLMIPAKV